MDINDFLNKETGKSKISDTLNETARMVDAPTFQDLEDPEIIDDANQAPEEKPRPEYESWTVRKRTPEEIAALADLETYKYLAYINAGLTSILTIGGVMPEPLSTQENLIYEDYLSDRLRTKKSGEKIYYDKDDPIFYVIEKKKKYEKWISNNSISTEEQKLIKRAIYIKLAAKNERGELDEESLSSIIMKISFAKLAPAMGDLVPALVGKISKVVKDIKNRDKQMRDSEIILHIGKKKTGKTTENLLMIKDFVKKQNKPVIILDAAMQEEYNFAKNISLEDLQNFYKLREHKVLRFQNASEWEEFTIYLNLYVRNAVIIYEDASRYIGSIVTKPLKDLIYNNRNLGLDIIFTFHSISLVPNKLMDNTDKVILRHTKDDIDSNTIRSKIIGNLLVFDEAINKINSQNKLNKNSFHSELIFLNE